MKLLVTLSIVLNGMAAVLTQGSHRLDVKMPAADSTAQYKLTAFTVLQHKCNVCHTQRNKNAVFTFTNMNAWSADINQQVFVKKRMPKGTAIVLSNADKEALTKWINSLK